MGEDVEEVADGGVAVARDGGLAPGLVKRLDDGGQLVAAARGIAAVVPNGYIVTFLNDAAGEGGRNPDGGTKARVRIRCNPGFALLAETFTGECREGAVYRLALHKQGGRIRFSGDGKPLLEAVDPEPYGGGWIGSRTFRTYLWGDARLTPLAAP